MWFRRRRRRQPPLVLLPSLERLAVLIERVVASLDQVTLAPAPEPPKPVPPPPPPPPPGREAKAATVLPAPAGHMLFASAPDGYRLLQRDGLPPDRGAALELDDGFFVVLRLGPSPLPGDPRRCAFVERQEPPPVTRTFDR